MVSLIYKNTENEQVNCNFRTRTNPKGCKE